MNIQIVRNLYNTILVSGNFNEGGKININCQKIMDTIIVFEKVWGCNLQLGRTHGSVNALSVVYYTITNVWSLSRELEGTPVSVCL